MWGNEKPRDLPSGPSEFHLALHTSSLAAPADCLSLHQQGKWMVHLHTIGELQPGKASKSGKNMKIIWDLLTMMKHNILFDKI